MGDKQIREKIIRGVWVVILATREKNKTDRREKFDAEVLTEIREVRKIMTAIKKRQWGNYWSCST